MTAANSSAPRLQLLLAHACDAQQLDPASLSAAEQVRWRRLRRPERRAEFLASGVLRAASGWREASLAHAGGHVLLGRASPPRRMGVDLEVRRPRDVLRLARFAFAPAEVRQLEGLGDCARIAHFYSLWVMKEACAKAAGLPLIDALRHCTFLREGDTWHSPQLAARLSASDHVGSTPAVGWSVWVLQPWDEAYVGVAVEGGCATPAIEAQRWNQDALQRWPCRARVQVKA